MPDEQNQALYDTLLQIRANPRFQKVAPLLDAGVHEMFDNVLGSQNVPLNKAANPMTKAFAFGRTQDFSPTEANVLGDLTRPGAAIRNSFMHDLTASFTPGAKVGGDGSDNALIQGFNNPRQVPSISSAIPVQPGASEAQLWANAGLGATADMAMEPLNAVPIPGLKALGGGLEALAAKGTPVISPMMKWFAKETPTFNPGLADKVATKPGALTGADNVIPEMLTPKPAEAQPQFDFTKGPEVPPTIPEVSTEGAAAPLEQPALNPLQEAAGATVSKPPVAGKIENFNLMQYPPEQQDQLKALFAGQESKLKTNPITREQTLEKANNLTSLPVTENILRTGEGQTDAELTRRVLNNIAKIKAVSEDPNISTNSIIKNVLQGDTLKIKKVRSELGRAMGGSGVPLEQQQQSLDAMRKIVAHIGKDPSLSSGQSRALINELKGQIPELEHATTPAQVYRFIFRNFITNGPLTLGANAISGYGNIAARPAMRGLEITLAKLKSLATGNPTTATYKEIGAMFKGMDAALRRGERLPENLQAKTFSDKFAPNPLEVMAATAKTETGRKALNVTGKIIGSADNIMRRTDDHVKNAIGMMEKYAAEARGEDVFKDQHVISRITDTQSRLSFQDQMSAVSKWVSQFRVDSRKNPTPLNQAADIFTYSLQPFVQTVDRIIAGGWKLSPGGAVGTAGQVAASIVNKGKYAGALSKGIMHNAHASEMMDSDVAAAMIGIPATIWIATQMAQGNIIAQAPQKVDSRETFTNAGKTEYSFRVGDRLVPLRLLPEPLATSIQINAALIQQHADSKQANENAGVELFHAAQKLGYMLGTKQYLGGMNSLVNSVTTKPYDTPNELPLLKKVIPSLLVPSAVKDVGVLKDTLLNRPRVMADTVVEAVKRRAGMTGKMVPELNTFGEPVTHPMMGKINSDPAYALAEKFPPQPVDRTREGVKLSQQDYHDLKQNVGVQRKMVYSILANTPEFQASPKGVQQWITEQMVSLADETGSTPQKMKELMTDPLYYDRELRTILEITKPGGERHFPYLKKP